MPQLDLDKVIETLNKLVEIDHDAIKNLIEKRVPCNDALKNHETVQVICDSFGGNPEVGFLGLLNGLIGIHENGWGYISAEMEVGGRLLSFVRTPATKEDD